MSWSKTYKKSIDCSNPKGFSQKAHCAGRKARQNGKQTQSKSVSEMKISELKEIVRKVVRESGPSKGFNKLASAYHTEALKYQTMQQNQKKLAAAFVVEKDPKKKEKAKAAILDHHKKLKSQEQIMKRAELDMLYGLEKEKIGDFDESINEGSNANTNYYYLNRNYEKVLQNIPYDLTFDIDDALENGSWEKLSKKYEDEYSKLAFYHPVHDNWHPKDQAKKVEVELDKLISTVEKELLKKVNKMISGLKKGADGVKKDIKISLQSK